MAKSKKAKKTAAKRRKTPKEDSGEVFFVEVKNQQDVRVNNLECIKSVLGLMKEYENYKQIKHQKEETIAKMKQDLRKISHIFGQLKSQLPTMKLKGVKRPVFKHKKMKIIPKSEVFSKEHKKPANKEPVSKEKSELEKLESELSAIENKLGSLN